MADQSNSKLHIAFVPWLAFGHMFPFLELAKKIAQKGHNISFISTPRNIKRLPKIPKDLDSLFNFVEFTLPKVENLPENAEATSDIPSYLIPNLMKAQDGLEESITNFLQNHTPDWIVFDYVQHWLPPIASKFGVASAYFCVVSASTFCSKSGTTNSKYDSSLPWMKDCGIRYSVSIKGCQAFLIRSCRELEEENLNIVQNRFRKPVVPFGLLPYSVQATTDEDPKDENWETIVEWLDKQEKRSVVYVALGSEISPTQQDFNELALGLELSGLPFFWVLRKKQSSIIDGQQIVVGLPDGFEERTRERGVIWTSWAPQIKILAHDSIGGFLTHCGWGSTIEGFQFGHPLIMLPFYTDQVICAMAFAERKVGILIPRNEEDESVMKDEVSKSLRLAVLDQEGKIYREESKKLSAMIFGNQSLHDNYVDECVEYLITHKKPSIG